jgi:hypothetical protein
MPRVSDPPPPKRDIHPQDGHCSLVEQWKTIILHSIFLSTKVIQNPFRFGDKTWKHTAGIFSLYTLSKECVYIELKLKQPEFC